MQKSFSKTLVAILFIFSMLLGKLQGGEIELVAKLPPETPPGNIAVGPDGRIFLSIHGFYNKPLKVVELLTDGSTRPYPTEKWAHAPIEDDVGLYGVLGLNVDQDGILWMLDTSSSENAGRLIGWNTRAEELNRVIYLAKPVIADNSFLNDLAIDLKNNAIYIADTGKESIIVVDLSTGMARCVLEGSEFTRAEEIDIVIDDTLVKMGGEPVRLGINPITIDLQNEYVYWGAMSGTAVYRIKTDDLTNINLTDSDLLACIESYGEKPISDGITIDDVGNVYITSITNDSIGITQPDGSYKTLFQDDSLSWPDGFAVGLDNYIYFTVNELHRSPGLNQGQDYSKGEFKVMRFKAVSEAQPGR